MALKPKKMIETRKVGRPESPPEQIKNPAGLPKWMEDRIVKECEIQDVSKARLNRQVYEWYFTALDTARGDVDAHKLFDELVEKEEKKNNHKGD
jgi:hypothetical protein